MKFQFFGRMPSLISSIVSDGSSHGDELCLADPVGHQTEDENNDINTIMSDFEWDQNMDSSQFGKAMGNISTFCSMVHSEHSGCAYDPSTKHLYVLSKSDKQHMDTVDEKCRSKMLEWCFKASEVRSHDYYVLLTFLTNNSICILACSRTQLDGGLLQHRSKYRVHSNFLPRSLPCDINGSVSTYIPRDISGCFSHMSLYRY
jgi:hypothetical protein